MSSSNSVSVGRWPVFEFEDQPWFPLRIRRYMQDCMEYCSNASPDFYRPFAALLANAMRSVGQTRLIDFGSGGAGPIRTLVRLLRSEGLQEASALLTDLYPNLAAFEKIRRISAGAVEYIREPVDATNPPRELDGFRLFSNSFHHFDPDAARTILAQAVQDRKGIAVVESVNRTFGNLAAMPVGVAMSLIFAPLIRPFSWERLFFTYLVPLVPMCVLFDGVASCLRAYSVEDLRKLTAELGGDGTYRWEIGYLAIAHTPMTMTYLIGIPNDSRQSF